MMEGLSWCSELRGGVLVVFGHPLRAAHASPSLREGEVWRCALFFSGFPRCLRNDVRLVRGNDVDGVEGLRE